MPNRVIITLVWQGREADFELPAKTPLKELEPALTSALRLHFPRSTLQGKRLRLRGTEGVLSPDRTLEDYSIFDGAVLRLELI